MTYTGQQSYAYWGIEGTKGAGDPSTDQNIPFNPMASLPAPKPKNIDEEFRTFDSLVPKKIATTELGPGEGGLEMLFQDPFLLLTFFTHKTVSGTWDTGTGQIAADFTDTDDVDTIFLQYHLHDQSGSGNHLNRLLKHGLPQKFSFKFEKGKLLKSAAEFTFLNFEDNTQAMSCNNSFHDQSWGSGVGGWANWDNSGLGGTGKRSTINTQLTWGGSAFTGLDIVSGEISFEVGYETSQTKSSLAHSVAYRKPHNYICNLKGFLKDKSLISEYESIFSDRSQQTFKFEYDATTDQEKYIQWTKAYVSPESSVVSIPESGKAAEVDIVIKGGESSALSYLGKFLNLPDPSALITTS
ncbi:MAG: hypothetical protein ACTSUK_04470 [Promethearchaeota archaeon]